MLTAVFGDEHVHTSVARAGIDVGQ